MFDVAGLERLFYQTDSDCIAAKVPLPEFDLYISTVLPLENKGIRWGHSTTQQSLYLLLFYYIILLY